MTQHPSAIPRTWRILLLGCLLAVGFGTVLRPAWAQDEGIPVQIFFDDGSDEAFVIELYRDEIPFVRLHDGERGALGTVCVERDGMSDAVAIEAVARIDRVAFMDVRWFVTLRSGAVLEAAAVDDGAFFEIAGTRADGSRVRWNLGLTRAAEVPFAAVVFAPEIGFPVPHETMDAP